MHANYNTAYEYVVKEDPEFVLYPGHPESENNIKYLKSLKGFRVGHLNIASLVRHVDELKVYLEKEPFDVLSINETRLYETISTNMVSIPGYDICKKS